MPNAPLSRSIAAALRAAAEVLERDASAVETKMPVRPVSESELLEADWVRDVVAKLAPLVTISESAKALRMSSGNVSRLLARRTNGCRADRQWAADHRGS